MSSFESHILLSKQQMPASQRPSMSPEQESQNYKKMSNPLSSQHKELIIIDLQPSHFPAQGTDYDSFATFPALRADNKL